MNPQPVNKFCAPQKNPKRTVLPRATRGAFRAHILRFYSVCVTRGAFGVLYALLKNDVSTFARNNKKSAAPLRTTGVGRIFISFHPRPFF
jgi:hypothetical protein